MKKWVEIKRYGKETYRLRSRKGEVCIAPLNKLTLLCHISREELLELITDAIKNGEIQEKDIMFDKLFEN